MVNSMCKKYIFGYGSLVNDDSRSTSTLGITGFNETQIDSLENLFYSGVSQKIDESKDIEKGLKFCRIADIQRGWYTHNMNPDIKQGGLAKDPTYLGAFEKEGSRCNGILIEVTDDELSALVQREKGYNLVRIDTSRITMIYGTIQNDPDVYYFEIPETQVRRANKSHPIVQSYVDLCMKGFIKLDEILGKENYKYTREFIRTTKSWNKYWINDRLHPYRPFVFLSKSSIINKLLSNTIPKRILHRIALT